MNTNSKNARVRAGGYAGDERDLGGDVQRGVNRVVVLGRVNSRSVRQEDLHDRQVAEAARLQDGSLARTDRGVHDGSPFQQHLGHLGVALLAGMEKRTPVVRRHGRLGRRASAEKKLGDLGVPVAAGDVQSGGAVAGARAADERAFLKHQLANLGDWPVARS